MSSDQFAFCEFNVNVHNCPSETVHQGVRVAYLACDIVGVLFMTMTLSTRYFKKYHSLRILFTGVLDSFCFFLCVAAAVDLLHSCMMLWGQYQSWVAPYAVHYLSYVLVNHALIFALYALVHSIPNAYMNHDGKITSTLLPPRWTFLVFIALQSFAMTVGTIGFAIYGGLLLDSRDPATQGFEVVRPGLQGAYILNGILNITLGFSFYFYGSRLIMIIRYNEAATNSAAAAAAGSGNSAVQMGSVMSEASHSVTTKRHISRQAIVAIRRLKAIVGSVIMCYPLSGVAFIIFGALVIEIESNVAADIFFNIFSIMPYFATANLGLLFFYLEEVGSLPFLKSIVTHSNKVRDQKDGSSSSTPGTPLGSSSRVASAVSNA